MTIEEAIIHAEEVANRSCDECANEHKQLSEWLKDYKRLLEQEPKAGYWIYQKGYIPYKWKCNQCSAEFKTDFNYCPNCGCRMESEG